MKIVIQRVSSAFVKINKEIERHIEKGLVVFLGIHSEDNLDDNANDDDLEPFFDKLELTEKPTGWKNKNHPSNCSTDVEGHESSVVHGTHTCYEGSEGADDRDEASQDQRRSAVLGEELRRLVHVLRSEEP